MWWLMTGRSSGRRLKWGKGSTGEGFGSGKWNRKYGIMIKSWEVKNWFHYSLLGQRQMLFDYIAQAKCFLTCSGVCYKERTSSKLAGFLSESSVYLESWIYYIEHSFAWIHLVVSFGLIKEQFTFIILSNCEYIQQ